MSLVLQLEDPPVAYRDVPSFIASLQAHHDEILEDVDITTYEGQSTQVGHVGSVNKCPISEMWVKAQVWWGCYIAWYSKVINRYKES